MVENSESIENSNEKFPNEREVLNLFEDIIGGDFEIVRNLEDENGLYLLEVESKDEAGDKVLHTYMRAGSYPEGSSLESRIDVVFYSGDIPVGGRSVIKL